MNMPRFFLAKFVPDLLRMEPKNIGVVVWLDGQVGARFLGEDQPPTGTTRPPRRLRVATPAVYDQWIRYWRHQLQQPFVTRNTDGFTAARESADFLDVLASKSKPACMLVNGGVVREEISANRLDSVVQDLFETLVLQDGDRKADYAHGEAEMLRHATPKALARSHLREREGFHEKYDWLCLVNGVQRTLKVDFVLKPNFGAAPPVALFQHVLLAKQASVMSTAFMFERATTENSVPREKCAALVFVSESDLARRELRDPLDLIRSYGALVNLSDMPRAVEQLVEIAT